MKLNAVELDENGEPPNEAVLKLTDKIETALRNVTLNLESAEELDTVLKAEALFSSVYENLLFKETLTNSFQRLQKLAEKYKLLGQNDPAKMRELNEKITHYENDLKIERRNGGKSFGFASSDVVCFSLFDFSLVSRDFARAFGDHRRGNSFARVCFFKFHRSDVQNARRGRGRFDL